jgi:prepilin-type N-terminal cleavage/methylation domain-containing protein
MHRHPSASRRSDDGFTLVELLIVIVILGVLATVTVFAVRGITDQGTDSAADADLKTLESAEEAHMAKFGTYGTEAELVTAGLLRQESTLHDITLASGDYTVVAEGGGGGGATTTTVAAPATNQGTAITYAGVPALEYGSGGGGWVIYGGATALAEWNRVILAGTVATKRVVFVPTSGITDLTIAQAVATGPASNKFFMEEDDIANFAGSGSPLSSLMIGFSFGSLFNVAGTEFLLTA